MSFTPTFKIGEIVTHDQLRAEFQCGNMGGMRRSHARGCLVIISDHTKGLYDDKWYGEEFHYTGMGKTGDQVLNGNQNKTLAESATNNVEVHLFEVLQLSKYIYQGVVQLCGKPYQEKQKDINGHQRKVWMFPLHSVAHNICVDTSSFDAYIGIQEQNAKKLDRNKLEAIAREHSSPRAASRSVSSTSYIRDPYIAEYAILRANGICQLCGFEAPFKDKDGNPYLESHHINWLSAGGADSIENTVALCPNCHRKMHIVNSLEDVAKLRRNNKQ
ncbi:HNH endonuclease [Oscillibacter sp.]|uniref:HNH endonuclease n=1 Tax=Oscillibacter sp. TaxID=1945593 RepID=UPI003392E004